MRGVAIGRIAPWRQTNWDWRAAGNFIGGGSGTGVLIVAAFAGCCHAALALTGMALVSAGLLCVWAEIGRPWRALNVFSHARTSWMTREALVAPPLLAAAGLSALAPGDGLRVLTAVLATLYMYCQARMLQAARGIPAWRHPRTVGLVLVTGLTEGCGAVLVVVSLGGAPATASVVRGVLVALLAIRVLTVRHYRAGLVADGAPRGTLTVLWRCERVVLGVSVFAVLCLLVAAYLYPVAWLSALGGACAVAAGVWLKFTLVVRAAFNQGFALPMTPVRGAGEPGAGVQPGWQGPA